MSAVRDAQNVSAREKGVILKTWWFLLAALWGNDEIWLVRTRARSALSGYWSVIKSGRSLNWGMSAGAKNFKAFARRRVAFPATFDATIAVRHQSRKG